MISLYLVVSLTVVSAAGTMVAQHTSSSLGDDIEVVIARDHVRHAHITGGAGFSISGDLSHAGMYYAKVALGSPPQEFHVQIDTGSDLSWISCTDCTGCPNHTTLPIRLNYFNLSKSSTGFRLTCSENDCSCSTGSDVCTYSADYFDGSKAEGYLMSDVLHLRPINGISGRTSAPLKLGCATSRRGILATGDRIVDGIFGLGWGSGSLIQQLSSDGSAPAVFSHCLRGDAENGGGGGQFILGEATHPTMQYSPFVDNGMPFYTIKLESIRVNGTLLPDSLNTDPKKGITLDTGTTLAFLEEKDYEAVLDAIFSHVQDLVRPDALRGIKCYDMTASDINYFPVVTLHFTGNAVMDLNPKHYLINRVLPDGSEIWCLGIRKVEEGGLPTLGDLLLRDKVFVYDLHRKQIGFSAKLNCSTPLSINVTTGDGWHLSTRIHVWVASVFLSILMTFF